MPYAFDTSPWQESQDLLAKRKIDFAPGTACRFGLISPAGPALKIFHVPRLNGARIGVPRIDARKFVHMGRR